MRRDEGTGDPIVVFVTTSNESEADRIAAHLLERRLVACANIVPAISSRFIWRGALEHASECLLIMKTVRPLFDCLRREVRAVHGYEVPEIIALPIVAVDDAYLSWIREVVAAHGAAEESS